MDPSAHRFRELFAQLGLAHDEQGIGEFLAAHSRLAGNIQLSDAPFWTPAQAVFLCEALQQDSDWAELADQLSAALRGP
ncbi:DUF2789 domain-containing protein [Rhodoferax lacus]|uniref:DUF2789 domain-containing protein n=1 Tax=Rhodoferax lacus TaxID=2184758 RepID=A0A3E1RB10_9BURK|nr:DUF2789 family protein [Rhodoferax lacus]RFO96433.1 DUF2789 domain-containing protein [Rhodoferax lacus]